MRAVRKLTGAFVMAALVAAALVASPAPAYADRGGPHSGEWKACTWILQAAMNMEEGSNGRYVLMSLYNAYCS